MKNLKVEISEKYFSAIGRRCVVVRWTEGKTRHMQCSRLFNGDTDPRDLAEILRGLGYAIIKRCDPR
jgi:hypothetical protein